MAAATQQLHNVLELSYEWMDIQTVTHRLLPSFHHSFPSITIFFFFGRNDDLCKLWMETVRGMM